MIKEELIPLAQVLLDMEDDNDIISCSARAYYNEHYKSSNQMRVSKLAQRKIKKDFPPNVKCPDCRKGNVYPRVHLENASQRYASLEDVTYKCERCKKRWEYFKYNKHNKVILCKEIKGE